MTSLEKRIWGNPGQRSISCLLWKWEVEAYIRGLKNAEELVSNRSLTIEVYPAGFLSARVLVQEVRSCLDFFGGK